MTILGKPTFRLFRREQSGALYKADELARITSDGKTDNQPLVTTAAVSSGGIALSLFNEIFVFDEEQSSFVSSISLESNVDTMAWCPDSQFLIICIGVRSGGAGGAAAPPV